MPYHTKRSTPSTKSLVNDLSPMARNVYERVGQYFKPTKAVPATPSSVNGHMPKPKVEASPPITPHRVPQMQETQMQNASAYRSNSAKIEVAIPSASFDRSAYVNIDASNISDVHDAQDQKPEQHSRATFGVLQSSAAGGQAPAHTTPTPGQKPSFAVVFEPASINREEYVEVSVAPEPLESLSARRNDRKDFSDTQDIFGESLDQRQRGAAAVDALEKLMRSIYSAIGSVLAGDSGFEHMVTLNNEQRPALTGGFHQKLHAALQKVIGLKAFDQLAVEDLLQLTRLSDASVKQVENFNLRVDGSWDEAAIEAWLTQLPDVDTALKASRTCLRVLSGGREEKQLYSEALIQRGLNLFKAVSEDIMVPLVEMRNSGPTAAVFKLLAKQKKILSTIFVSGQKLFALFADLVSKIDLSETGLNTLEFTASRLIFVENAYTERDSVVGVQKFDGIRSVAMDMLCQIFMMKPQQRQGIIDDILTSLEKLPVGRQGSRQFKLSEGGSIQPVSALIMRLVQTSAGRIDDSKAVGRTALLRSLGEHENHQENEERATRHAPSTIKSEEQAAQQHAVAMQDLDAASTPLTDAAQRNASYVINFIVQRALRSTKTGDAPYRNLLDLFVEDFTLCLDSPDWPSAETLLRLLMFMMVQHFEAPKTPAPAKNMALEILGTMSAAISRLRSNAAKTANSLEGSSSDELSQYLADLASHVLDQKVQVEHIVAWAGPYRATLEYLQNRYKEDPYLASAISFTISSWANRIHVGYDLPREDDYATNQELGRLAFRLRRMIEDRNWLSTEYTFKPIEPSQARFAYTTLVLCSPLCEAFGKILNILLGSMSSDQATVRSKSLKSVNQVLETDPSILDRDSQPIQLILDCASDPSIQVRDSALGLLGNCINMRPSLENDMAPAIIERFLDTGVGVRKRAMRLARDIYLRNRSKQLRSTIANGLLRRVQDLDEGVCDLARQMIEEIWFAPFYHTENTATFQSALSDHVSLVIQTVKSGTSAEVLDKVFQTILRPQSKSLEGPFAVCSKLVAIMFSHIDNGDTADPSVPSGRDALQVLTIFAKADPKLFNLEQIRLLRPQLTSWATADELSAFRAATVIYRRVLPELPHVQQEFLGDIRNLLIKCLGKNPRRAALDDLIACLTTVCDLMDNFAPLSNMVLSSLLAMKKLRDIKPDSTQTNKLSIYAKLIGLATKHYNLDAQAALFRARFPGWKGDSVSRLIIDELVPFAAPERSLEVRKAVMEAIGLVCQSWPRNFVLAKVYTIFQQVFDSKEASLEFMILQSLKEFLVTEEKRSEAGGDAAADQKKRELTVMGGTNFDDVASATTQRFLKDITRIALSTQGECAHLAMEVLGSINRQGLTHPKETGVTLMTLETSANPKLAELAFNEHRSLHEKHETVLEREYAKAVQAAYNYQRDVVQDTRGAVKDSNGFQSKLHYLMEVLKISKMKNRQRFVEKLCGQVELDMAKLGTSEAMPRQVDFARFVLENLAYFDYQSIGEIQSAVNALEKMVNSAGIGVAQAIEAEVLNMRMDVDAHPPVALSQDPLNQVENFGGGIPLEQQQALLASNIEPQRLKDLATASLILIAMWETRTYLRRLYGLGAHRQDSKAKDKAKDLNRAPVKVQGVHGDKYWEEMVSHMKGLESPDLMLYTCKAFVETLNVDKDFKIVEEDEDIDPEGPATPSENDEDDEDRGGGERGRKRKGASTPGGRKKRARSSSQPRKRGRPRKNAEPESDVDADGDWV